jgi:S1-C subfamily serine protease
MADKDIAVTATPGTDGISATEVAGKSDVSVQAAALYDKAAEPSLPGFGLQSPKPESELARAGVRGGDRLLAVDGQEVRFVADIQAGIRKHALGEEVRLLVQRDSEPAREIGVRHVSDYPEE